MEGKRTSCHVVGTSVSSNTSAPKPRFNSHDHLMRTLKNKVQEPTLGQAKLPAGPQVTFQTLSKAKNCGNCPEQVQELEKNKVLQRGPARGKKKVRCGFQ